MLELALQIATVHRVVERKAWEVTLICPILTLYVAEKGRDRANFGRFSVRILLGFLLP